MSTERRIRVVELFAGVGGFRVGLERCNKEIFQTVWANQWEPGQSGQWAYKCYCQRFGDDANCVNRDIAAVIDSIPDHDLLVGGFPCQDYSVASSGAKGIEGKKGVLWWSIHKIIQKCHPQYILLENVDRLLKSPAKQRGRDFGIILKCLDMEGYQAEWRVINAADYGQVQRRRRIFIFASRKATPIKNPQQWLRKDGFFARVFPVLSEPVPKKSSHADLNRYADLIQITEEFQCPFWSSGIMAEGQIYSEELVPDYNGASMVLDDIVSHDAVDEKYILSPEERPKWQTMKGAKKILRTSKSGFEYLFSEGAIAFPDPLDRPARTMLTSEGTPNRSTHIITDPATGKLRRLTPEECEQINGFDVGWTDTGMPHRQRYFIMGNALVVPLIEKMATHLLEIL